MTPDPTHHCPGCKERQDRIEALEDTIRVAAKWFEVAAVNHEIAAESGRPPENAPYVEAARRDTYRAGILRAALEGTSHE